MGHALWFFWQSGAARDLCSERRGWADGWGGMVGGGGWHWKIWEHHVHLGGQGGGPAGGWWGVQQPWSWLQDQLPGHEVVGGGGAGLGGPPWGRQQALPGHQNWLLPQELGGLGVTGIFTQVLAPWFQLKPAGQSGWSWWFSLPGTQQNLLRDQYQLAFVFGQEVPGGGRPASGVE